MPKFAAVLRLEVRRLAAKEFQRALKRLKRVQKQLKAVRVATRKQRASLSSIDRRLRRLRERLPLRGRLAGVAKSAPRIAAVAIRALRRRLAMTRLQFADLVGVSPGSIFGWETGRTVPRGGSRARLARLAKKGRGRGRKAKRSRRGRRRRRA